jgi:hypothetical protein
MPTPWKAKVPDTCRRERRMARATARAWEENRRPGDENRNRLRPPRQTLLITLTMQ